MLRLKILLSVILSTILAVSDANKINPFDSCLKLFLPADLTTSCAAHEHDLVQIIKDCIKELPSKQKNFLQKNIPNGLSTCEQAKCVTGRYGLLNSKGEVSMQKAKNLLKELDLKGDSITKKANKLVLDFCVDKDYKVFITKDPLCPQWSYLNCAFWAYRLANHVKEDLEWVGKCKAVYDNVKACYSKKDLFYDFLSKNFSNDCKGKFI